PPARESLGSQLLRRCHLRTLQFGQQRLEHGFLLLKFMPEVAMIGSRDFSQQCCLVFVQNLSQKFLFLRIQYYFHNPPPTMKFSTVVTTNQFSRSAPMSSSGPCAVSLPKLTTCFLNESRSFLGIVFGLESKYR